jgi:1-acyl-sn-glycerol-3-phosphate acyltransferase
MRDPRYPYPRRFVIRSFLKWLSQPGAAALTKLQIEGEDNLPAGGPLLVVFNHFNFIDPVIIVRAMPWPLEFLGDFEMPNVPLWSKIIPWMWDYYRINEYDSSREPIRAAEAVLAQDGVMAIAPEGRLSEQYLRPPHRGAAYLAARNEVRVLPVGIIGSPDVFPALRERKRANLKVRIGTTIGPYRASGSGKARSEQLDQIALDIMRHLALLIPQELWGYLADDQELHAMAKAANTESPPPNVDSHYVH